MFPVALTLAQPSRGYGRCAARQTRTPRRPSSGCVSRSLNPARKYVSAGVSRSSMRRLAILALHEARQVTHHFDHEPAGQGLLISIADHHLGNLQTDLRQFLEEPF